MSASRTYRSTPGKSPRTLPESATGRPWAKYAGRSIQPRLDQAIANNPFASLRDQPSMLGASLTPTILTLPSSAPSASPNLSGAASSTPRSRRPPPPSSATRRKLARYEATSSSSQVGGQSHRPGRLGDISLRRYRKVLKDTIQGVTRGDLRRLARRGGVKRISAGIYDETRSAMRQFMKEVSPYKSPFPFTNSLLNDKRSLGTPSLASNLGVLKP